MANLKEFYENSVCPHCGIDCDYVMVDEEVDGECYFEYHKCDECSGTWTTRYTMDKIETNGGEETFYIPNEDEEMLASENKAMAEFLEKLGFSEEDISNIANGCHDQVLDFGLDFGKKDSIIAYALIGFEVDKDISKKYPNFVFNYNSSMEFLLNEVGSMNNKLRFDDVCIDELKPYHFGYDDDSFTPDDEGYRTKVIKFNMKEGE